MHSLFLRFFLSFWLIIGIIIGAAAAGGFWYAERVQEAIEDFELSDSMLLASAALESGGRNGLAAWLRDYPTTRGVTLFVIDDRGKDILSRPISERRARAYRRHAEWQRSRPSRNPEPTNIRRSRHFPQLVATGGETYTFFASTSRVPEAIWGSTDVRILFLIFALLVSGGVSYALANAFARPVRKLRDAAVTLADGDLHVRVADSIGKRRDELGMLAKDFDAMASKLQRAAEQQTELARNISHELRSPLARMRVAVELARRKAGEISEFDRLDNEAERLDSLIGQILKFTKLDGDANRRAEKIDIAEVVQEVAENVNFECTSESGKGIRVRTSAESNVYVSGHFDVMVSAIENIARNAVRHSPTNGEVLIKVDTDDRQVQIETTDSGPGVSDDELAHLFEPFFRTRQSAEIDSNGGTGLGLAIARRAVELHGGTISARNCAQGGLSIVISLPASHSD